MMSKTVNPAYLNHAHLTIKSLTQTTVDLPKMGILPYKQDMGMPRFQCATNSSYIHCLCCANKVETLTFNGPERDRELSTY